MYSFHQGYQQVLGIDVSGIPGMSKGAQNIEPMQELLDLSNKVAIVTGGAMGMGFCTVNRLGEAGAKVVIADIAVEYAEKALEYFAGKGYDVRFIETDVRDIAQIQAAVDFTVQEFGTVDILVNNAGVWIHALLSEITEETWDEMLDINLKGTVFFVQAVTRVMEKNGGGRIVNIASVAGLSADQAPIMFEYVASKSAVVAVTKSLARALRPLGIHINCVLPGGMITPGAVNTSGTEAAKVLRESTRSPLSSDPDEVARVVFMLTTRISDFMDGATISVDGGAFLGIEE